MLSTVRQAVDLNSAFLRLPYWLRSATASAAGYRLRQLRYGAQSSQLVRECQERDSWSAEHWERWGAEKLGALLRHAASEVPFYREMWAARRRSGDTSPVDRLENWPVLEKEDVRRFARTLVAEGDASKRLFHVVTSGTTGKPTDLWYSREVAQEWYAINEARVRRGHGLSLDDHWALLAGRIVAPLSATRPPYWVWNRGLNQLYLSAYHASPAHAADYLEALRRHEIKYIVGYPSSLCNLAKGIEAGKLQVPKMHVILTQAEQLYSFQRQLLERVFQCPVRDTYGMSEMCAGAHECWAGALHLWPDAGVVEAFEGNSPVPAGTSGDLVCTGLLNMDMPLIRYRIGDRGWLAPKAARCPCGSNLPILGGLQGRISDAFLAANGRMVPPNLMEAIFDKPIPLVEGQLIQETLTRINVVYVPGHDFRLHHRRDIEGGIRDLMGQVEVTFTEVDRIPRGPNGKVRVVISRVGREWTGVSSQQ